jgi:alpha-tubulin suppressor-like RCC1 family protein
LIAKEKGRQHNMVNQAEEDDTTIPEDTSSKDATTATPEPETFITLSAWGGNHFGELGNGTTTDSSTPVQVSDLVGVRNAAGGNKHSLALKDDGTVWAWALTELASWATVPPLTAARRCR